MAMCWITSLPEDVIIECVARVPRRYYPSLSLVSKFFRSLIGSPQLYARRSLLDRTECCLYVTIYSHDDDYDRLYTLRQKINSSGDYCLVPIPSLPPMPSSGSYVAVGSKIYVMGGSCFEVSSNALTLIDCPLHTANHHLPNMPRAVASSVSGYINEKIYVIGGCRSRFPVFSEGPMDVMVFDVKSETWESKTRPDNLVFDWYSNSAVTWDDKIYFRVLKHGFVYDPSQDKMEKDDVLKSYHWVGSECVIEGVLYYYSTASKILRSYDLKERSWKRVKGEIGLSGTTCARTVTYDKKVVVIFEKDIDRNKVELWCAEIKLERDEQGEICARLDWCAMATGKTVKDVSPHDFVKAYASHLKRSGKIELPPWTDIVKTGKLKELAPYDPDWYYIRAASMARKVYLRGGLGVGAFRRIYGGSKRNGSRPPHFCKSSGGIARHILQQLETMNIVEIDTKGGRRITSSGQRDLDQVAGRIAAEI
ncbi:hypothetical protein YC2023_029584 [Brassica napus]